MQVLWILLLKQGALNFLNVETWMLFSHTLPKFPTMRVLACACFSSGTID